MAQAPQVTIVANMTDLIGAASAGSTLSIMLAGFGSQVPRIAGTGLIVKTVPLPIVADATGLITRVIFGNNVITPAGTYYAMTFTDNAGNVVQMNAYQFLVNGTYDLSAAPLFDPPPPTDNGGNPVLQNPPGAITQTIDGSIIIEGNLTVTGLINGGAAASPFIVAPAAVAIFDGNSGSGFKLTLNQNTVGQFQNMAGKLMVAVRIVQPAAGPTFTFTWPANVRNGGVINPQNGSRNVQFFSPDADGSLDGASPMQWTF
jgi:hypothetical protein